MSNQYIQVNKNFLQKIAQFVNIALSEISSLESKVQVGIQKEASAYIQKEQYATALDKVAKVLYETDFITDDYERQEFIKRAKEDPTYLAQTLEKVCNAADVALIGSPARVAATVKKAEYDPVMVNAFGGKYNPSYSDILDI